MSLKPDVVLMPHIPKIELVKGDVRKTIPKYIKDNPHLIVSLLYLDLDLYEPTRAALRNFIPRMPKFLLAIGLHLFRQMQ